MTPVHFCACYVLPGKSPTIKKKNINFSIFDLQQQQQQVFLAGQPRLLVPAHQFTLLGGGAAEGGGLSVRSGQFATLLHTNGDARGRFVLSQR
jgi:hypothetical protein